MLPPTTKRPQIHPRKSTSREYTRRASEREQGERTRFRNREQIAAHPATGIRPCEVCAPIVVILDRDQARRTIVRQMRSPAERISPNGVVGGVDLLVRIEVADQ
jgi:hypothetical protein